MMHQYLDKKQIIKRKKNFRIIIGFVLFFILSIAGVLSWLGGVFNFVGRPVWIAENFITKEFNDINYLFRLKKSISNENYNLKEEIYDLRTKMSDYQILKNDFNELKETVGRLPEKNDFILGNILAKPDHSPYDTLIIDVGSVNDIKEGQLVYARGTTPIGNIEKVYDKTSLVNLYTNPGRKTEGYINGTNIGVELIGRGGGNFEMIIPLELQLDYGTIIYLPGNDSFVLAIVDEIISQPSDPFKKVILSSPVNVQNLKFVQVKKTS